MSDPLSPEFMRAAGVNPWAYKFADRQSGLTLNEAKDAAVAQALERFKDPKNLEAAKEMAGEYADWTKQAQLAFATDGMIKDALVKIAEGYMDYIYKHAQKAYQSQNPSSNGPIYLSPKTLDTALVNAMKAEDEYLAWKADNGAELLQDVNNRIRNNLMTSDLGAYTKALETRKNAPEPRAATEPTTTAG